MSRTQIPVSTFTGGIDLNDAGTAIDQSNGMYVSIPTSNIPATGNADRLLLYVANSASGTKTVTVKAGASPVPAFRGGEGDLTTGNMTASTGTAFIGPLETARFAQSDGTINVDFSSGTTGTIWAILLPRAPQV